MRSENDLERIEVEKRESTGEELWKVEVNKANRKSPKK